MSILIYEPRDDLPGWNSWRVDAPGMFLDVLGDLAARPEGDGKGRVRWWPDAKLGNYHRAVHGGALLGFVDVALFAGARACGVEGAQNAVTVDCSAQFMQPGRLESPIDAVVELLRETGRLVFVRGVLEQEDRLLLSFSGVIRKIREA